jgi:hypothetical protein
MCIWVASTPKGGWPKSKDIRLEMIVAGFLKKEIPAKNQTVSGYL